MVNLIAPFFGFSRTTFVCGMVQVSKRMQVRREGSLKLQIVLSSLKSAQVRAINTKIYL